MKKIKITHLTSAHPRYDIRIFIKECRSLVKLGYDVSLVVADGKGDEVKDGVSIFDVGISDGRVDRMTRTTRLVFEKAKSLRSDIYHFHDPELIPAGLKLKKLGKKVIFDAHEDVSSQMFSKHYLNVPIRYMLALVFPLYERWSCPKFDAIVTATPFIRDKYFKINDFVIDINNFPMLGELETFTEWHNKEHQVSYIGATAGIRGIREVIRAMELIKSDTRLQIGGLFSEDSIEREVKSFAGWRFVDELGFIDRGGVRSVLERTVAGLVTFHPLPNHIDAQPNKMFEYMSAGIPVIASHFPLWRNIIEGNDCGLCVDPMSPQAIANAIDFLINNPERARQMGENGYKAVQKKYNWGIEEQKLLNLYANLTTTK